MSASSFQGIEDGHDDDDDATVPTSDNSVGNLPTSSTSSAAGDGPLQHQYSDDSNLQQEESSSQVEAANQHRDDLLDGDSVSRQAAHGRAAGGNNDERNDDFDQDDDGQQRGEDDDGMDGSDDEGDMMTMARGTDVNVRTAARVFREFLRNFKTLNPSSEDGLLESDDDDSDASSSDGTEPLYLEKLRSLVHQTVPSSLDIDTMHLFYHNEECQRFYYQLLHYPMELVPLMDLVVQQEVQRLLATNDAESIPPIQVRPFNLKDVSNLRCLDPIAMDSLVCLKGMIVRCSPIIPDMKVAHFSCVICGHDHQVSIDRGRIQEPHQCPRCNTKNSYQLVHTRSLFADKQLVRLQETPDQVPAGQTPASVVTFCFDDLVDKCQPGDKVEVTGVLRAQPVRINPKLTKLKSIYKTYVDVIHFRAVTGMEGTKGKEGASFLSEERVVQLERLSREPDIYEKLTKSLAPSIWELDDVKKGVLCMLFGGSNRRAQNSDKDENPDSTGRSSVAYDSDTKGTKRGDINVLLCGDPGTSKSQLLSYVHKLSSRGIYTSGKGSSAVGLTASVVRDPETRDLVLESGALVLSDRGICCIDEFDKMSDTTRSILHEAMEQQTVSIAKAGIIASLNARTSILASANPTESRYNPNLSVVENIKLPPTLLSRFDLIYLILDSPNAEQDRRLAQHLVGLYYDVPNVVDPPLGTELLRDYIDYARETFHPTLSDEASEQLLQSYLELRNPPGVSGSAANNGMRTISATPRQLESLIRTSEALAKMRYSSVVTKGDAIEAIRLLKVATQAAATDPRTGRIDMDALNTGRTSADRELESTVHSGLKEYLAERRGNRLAVRDIASHLTEIFINQDNSSELHVAHDDVANALRRLEADGIIQFNERNQSVFVRGGSLLGA